MKLLDKFALQLYSVRDATETDFVGTLRKVGCNGIGYTGVEFAGFGGLSADEMKTVLAENKLTAIGSHTPIERLIDAVDEEIAYHKVIGAEYIVCPYSEIKTKADTIALAKTLTPIAEKIAASGLKFGYHNHDHEFVVDAGEYLLDILLDNLPDSTVLELDYFWSEYAGVDSIAYMEKQKNRLELFHVKQIDSNKNNVELDSGLIDFNDIIRKAQSLGVRHFILEQEKYAVSSMVSVENAMRYISSLEK
ncbi:MAG: sugar phosphate isomerase/epimerase [Oscillospiraceae bacterium]|nr:sugar phosphate isomerase/epimerase [Oscillospiraceae bacterium]MCL2278448.1 sugar phosphate isomerase/epimerase [Oscillospiraceae bacterium]